VKRARLADEDARPIMPITLELDIPPNFQRYSRAENVHEQFLLGGSGIYEDGGNSQRFVILITTKKLFFFLEF
jgi:hypothetical protein